MCSYSPNERRRIGYHEVKRPNTLGSIPSAIQNSCIFILIFRASDRTTMPFYRAWALERLSRLDKHRHPTTEFLHPFAQAFRMLPWDVWRCRTCLMACILSKRASRRDKATSALYVGERHFPYMLTRTKVT